MNKLHRINIDYFKMDDNGDIYCHFGKSIVCKVEKGCGQDGDPVCFYYRGQKLNGPDTRVGDIVYMHHNGPRTTWVLDKKPEDPRFALLWEAGFSSSSRIKVDDPYPARVISALREKAFGYTWTKGPENWSVNEYIRFVGEGLSHPTIIRDDSNMVKVALYSGSNGLDDYCQWYMADDATLADVEAALLSERRWNEDNPHL